MTVGETIFALLAFFLLLAAVSWLCETKGPMIVLGGILLTMVILERLG